MDTALLAKAFAGIFAIMNPFVALPMFLAMTDGYAAARQRTTALRVALYSAIMLAVIIVSGSAVLSFFGINVNDFRVAGGLVLLMIALGMLNGASSAHAGSPSEQQHQQAQAAGGGDVAFYPITFPMLVGPGTITTVIILTSQSPGASAYLTVGIAAAAVLALLLLVLYFAPQIGHHLGQTLRTIMTRLMGMILAAIAVQMMVAGLRVLLPGLAP